MHAALRQVLGKHVQQKGSLVDAQRTRFDFSHPQPMNPDEIRKVEALVNEAIRRNLEVSAGIMKFDDAIKAGLTAEGLSGEGAEAVEELLNELQRDDVSRGHLHMVARDWQEVAGAIERPYVIDARLADFDALFERLGDGKRAAANA